MQEVIKKIALAYERKKDQILSDTIYSLSTGTARNRDTGHGRIPK